MTKPWKIPISTFAVVVIIVFLIVGLNRFDTPSVGPSNAPSLIGAGDILASELYTQDNSSFGTYGTDIVTQLNHLVGPKETFTTKSLNANTPNFTDAYQIDACGNVKVANCQWIAFAGFDSSSNEC